MLKEIKDYLGIKEERPLTEIERLIIARDKIVNQIKAHARLMDESASCIAKLKKAKEDLNKKIREW